MFVLFFFLLCLLLIFFRISAKLSVLILFAALLLGVYFHLLSIVSSIFLILLWALFAVFIYAGFLRRQLVMQYLLKWFRRQQPALSVAEQQVLGAGGLWWEQQFFRGRPDWKKLLNYGSLVLTAEEQVFVDDQVETLCSMISEWDVEFKNKNFSADIWQYIKTQGFWALTLEKSWGGHEFSSAAHSAVVTKIASCSYSLAVSIMVPNALGVAEFLRQYGTVEQKEKYLPRLARGEDISCFALTEINAGSDATAVEASGIICKEIHNGVETLGIRLNFAKRNITLAPIATLLGLVFHLFDPEHYLSDKEDIGITLALVPTDFSGIERGARHAPMNLALLNGPISGKNVFVPLDFVIGGKEQCGRGWQIMMECLALGRGISLPALAAAHAQRCLRVTSAYTSLRLQFGRAIGKFEGIKEILARMGALTFLCEATRLFTAQAVVMHLKPGIAATIAKYHLTELNRKIVNDALDIHAGKGVQLGPNNYLGMIYLSSPINITVEGANILTRNLIIFGQGLLRCHPYLRLEIGAAMHTNPTIQIKLFDRVIMKHVGFVLQQTLRVICYGLTAGRFILSPKKSKVNKYFRQLTRMSHAFIWVTDISLALIGGKLKIKESLSARLGDILSHLYLASAVLKFYFDRGEKASDLPLAQWALDYCLHHIQQTFEVFFANFPIRWLGCLLRKIIFLWDGYRYPSDQLSFKIADDLQNEVDRVDDLTKAIYWPSNPQNIMSKLDKAWRKLIKLKPLLQKIESTLDQTQILHHNNLAQMIEIAYNDNIITSTERDELQELEALRIDVLRVDEFKEES